jgi:hypothetical protein
MIKFSTSPRLLFSLLTSLTLCYAGSTTSVESAQPTKPINDRIFLHSFASGQTFYIDKSSFKPIGNGSLQYSVTGDIGDGSQRVSQNQIDCRTGQIKSPIQSWNDDGKGNISNQTDGPSVTTMLTNRTQLHDDMKDACQQALPDLKMNW